MSFLRTKSHFLTTFGAGCRTPDVVEIATWIEDLKAKYANLPLSSRDSDDFEDEVSDLSLSFRMVAMYVRTLGKEEAAGPIFLPSKERVCNGVFRTQAYRSLTHSYRTGTLKVQHTFLRRCALVR